MTGRPRRPLVIYRTADVDAPPATRTEVDWEQLRTVEKGRRSPLAALRARPGLTGGTARSLARVVRSPP
ncbi:hypothetical protein [Streptomyces sp. A1-5]|uniref:hypothetical protein n=1 Tax=Streptomyces sp. A1-5 TaxID=2738410 RepID=UPI001F34AA99|nr:hypothetical protein [Streptomyces sp. A1-5]UJB39469.1 hypothetical protein HRD51_00035 [Streptomyces sp. A1-5]